MSLVVRQVQVGGFDKNFSYIVFDLDSNDALIVDPAGDLLAVMRLVEQQKLRVQGVLLTHSHHDHYDQLDALLSLHPVPVYIHQRGADAVRVPHLHGVADGQIIQLGDGSIAALYTPGHTTDSVCYLIPAEESAEEVPLLLSGDTLFVGGCGKIAREQAEEMFASLQRLKALPPQTIIFPGHDYGDRPISTMDLERIQNPYIRAADLDAFLKARFPDATPT